MLADKIAEVRGTGVGRGAAIVIMVSGALLAILALMLLRFRSIRELESGGLDDKTNSK